MTDHALMRRAAAVWRGLTEAFGEPFTTVYGSDPAPIWVAEIAKLSDEQCRTGVTEMARRAQTTTFPCNLSEFVKACGGPPGGPPVRQQPYRPMGGPPARSEVRDRHLANIRATLGMEPK